MREYFAYCQDIIELIIMSFRSQQHLKSYSKKPLINITQSLQSDQVYKSIVRLFNFTSVHLCLGFYFKYLLATGVFDKAEAVASINLSVAYISDINFHKIEAYQDLGSLFERIKDTKVSLFCYARAMQTAMTSGNKVKESYLCDKIGVQLYNMNEPELARIYHDRMLIGFDEKNWSNASIRV